MAIASKRKILLGGGCLVAIGGLFFYSRMGVQPSQPDLGKTANSTANRAAKSVEGLRSRDYVLEILNTRKTHPDRSPDEWKRFVVELDVWYREAKVDCTVILKSRQLDWVLRMVDDGKIASTEQELYQIARECTNSATQMECYRELWRRKAEGEPSECLGFVNSLPALVRPIFLKELADLWAKKKGAGALPEILGNREVPTSLFEQVCSRIIRTSPEEALQFLQKTDEAVLKGRFGAKFDRYYWLISACEVLPPARAIEVLSQDPPSVVRDGRIAVATMRSVEAYPKIAEKLIANDPRMISPVAWATPTVAKKDPVGAATILNSVPGERLRTSVARKTVMDLPAKEGLQFIEAISDSLTRESVRKTYLLIHQPKKEAQK
jgi:hypothetical protein